MIKLKNLIERRGNVQKYSYKVIEPIRRDWEKKFREMNSRWMKKNMKKIRDYASKEHGRDIYLTGKGKEDFQKVYNNWTKACNEFEMWLDQLQSIPLEDKND
jgi:putative sterol carrier protein